MFAHRARSKVAACAVVVALLSGCSGEFDYGPTGTISGRLTRNGTPVLPGTYVSFMDPEKGYLALGTTDPEGKYTVDSWNDGNMPVGTYGVMIQPPTGVDPEALSAEDLLEGKGKVAPSDIPVKYRQFSTSGLKYPVKEGPNTIDIDLK